MHRKLALFTSLIIMSLALAGLATTWGSTDVKCPVCGKTSEMESIMSYGSYIYGWPSKYQLIFWPSTTSRALYYCRHCGLAAFMGDFQEIPKDKIDAVKKTVAPMKKPQKDGRYFEVPMSYRLGIAEAVYRQLDRDDNFWCRFYRIQGYHLDKSSMPKEAKTARLKALVLAEKMLKAGVKAPPKKELVLIVGSMQYFTGQKEKALEALARVMKTPIKVPEEMKEKSAKNATQYLDELAEVFKGLIEGGKEVPR
jgi:hypothetical protein